MNAASNSPLSAVLDAVAMEIIAQMTSEMKQQLADKDQQLLRVQQALALSEMKIQYLKEMLRLEMIKKYGMRSEKLSDLQLQLLDLELAVSSEEIEAESKRDSLPEANANSSAIDKQPRNRRPYTVRQFRIR